MLNHFALILEPDQASLGIHHFDRHLKHDTASGADRQDGRISGLPFGAEGRQHDGHYILIMAKHVFQRFVELAALVPFRRGYELIIETVATQKYAQQDRKSTSLNSSH